MKDHPKWSKSMSKLSPQTSALGFKKGSDYRVTEAAGEVQLLVTFPRDFKITDERELGSILVARVRALLKKANRK